MNTFFNRSRNNNNNYSRNKQNNYQNRSQNNNNYQNNRPQNNNNRQKSSFYDDQKSALFLTGLRIFNNKDESAKYRESIYQAIRSKNVYIRKFDKPETKDFAYLHLGKNVTENYNENGIKDVDTIMRLIVGYETVEHSNGNNGNMNGDYNNSDNDSLVGEKLPFIELNGDKIFIKPYKKTNKRIEEESRNQSRQPTRPHSRYGSMYSDNNSRYSGMTSRGTRSRQISQSSSFFDEPVMNYNGHIDKDFQYQQQQNATNENTTNTSGIVTNNQNSDEETNTFNPKITTSNLDWNLDNVNSPIIENQNSNTQIQQQMSTTTVVPNGNSGNNENSQISVASNNNIGNQMLNELDECEPIIQDLSMNLLPDTTINNEQNNNYSDTTSDSSSSMQSSQQNNIEQSIIINDQQQSNIMNTNTDDMTSPIVPNIVKQNSIIEFENLIETNPLVKLGLEYLKSLWNQTVYSTLPNESQVQVMCIYFNYVYNNDMNNAMKVLASGMIQNNNNTFNNTISYNSPIASMQ